MSDLLVAQIVPASVACEKNLHEAGERESFLLKQKMKMVGHQHVGVQMKVVTGDVVIQRVEKFPVVFFTVEDGLLPVASCDHVIESTSVLYAGWARHEGKLS